MTASELFKAGKLAEAVAAQIEDVKKNPADVGKRLFLFELSLFVGDLTRAGRQGDLVVYPEAEINATMDAYKLLVMHEQTRRDVFLKGTPPRSFGPLPDECTQRIQAIDRIRNEQFAEAAELIGNSPPPMIPGTLNGKEFDGFCDCDDVLGPILEVCTHQGYFWVPFSQVKAVRAEPPKYPRDLYWLPAHVELIDGQNATVFLPALYPFSFGHEDEDVKLGRRTDWTGGEGTPVRGKGQKTYLAGDDVVGILDIREIEFHHA